MMTRQHLDKTFLGVYDSLNRWAIRKVGEQGRDIVHQCYANILEHGTYKRGPRLHARRWLYWKLSREVVRHRKAQRTRTEKTNAAQGKMIEDLQYREAMERPDTFLGLRELGTIKESC